MQRVNIHKAKTNLSKLIEDARAGEEIVITKDDKPMVRLAPVSSIPHGRRFGAMRGRAAVTDAFFEPLPEHELELWNGE